MNRNQRGFTLIELLCVLAISLVCLTVLIQLVIYYEKSSTQEKAFSEVQENIRFSSYLLRKSIDHAGFISGQQPTNRYPIDAEGVNALNTLTPDNALMVYQGYQDRWRPSIPAYIKIKPKKNTDVIVVRQASSIFSHLLFPVVHSNEVFVSLTPEFKKNDDIIVADTNKAILLHVSKVYRSLKHRYQRLVTTRKLTQPFNIYAHVSKIKTAVFFIRPTSRFNTLGHKINALYLLDESGRQAELISNVMNLKVTCFENNDLGYIQEKYPSQVVEWRRVKFINLNLLFKSSYYLFAKKRRYWYFLQWHKSDDQYLYQGIKFLIPIAPRLKK